MPTFPIDPTLIDGRLTALVSLIGADEAVPVALGPRLPGEAWDVDIETRIGSTSAMAQLSVANAFSAHNSFGAQTAVIDAMVGKSRIAGAADAARTITGTFWGVGLRIAVTFRAVDVDADLTFAAIAASAELKQLDVSYEIASVGLGAEQLAAVLRKIPPMGTLNMSTFAAIQSMRDALVASLLLAMTPESTLYPTSVTLAASPMTEELTEAAEYRFAMRHIAAARSRDEALAALSVTPFDGSPVRRGGVEKVYLEVVGGKGKPDPAQVAVATRWLDLVAP